VRPLTVAPVLTSTDLERTIAWYAPFGFTVDFREPDFLILAAGTVELQFFLETPPQPPNRIYLRVNDVQTLARSFGLQAARMPWGKLEFRLTDPDGTLVRIGERFVV
jgi:catechol 2,3-dioxygenase-like lactoylglutathione lyase family enzyme